MVNKVIDLAEIMRRIREAEPSLRRVDWSPFSRECALHFGYMGSGAVLQLRGVLFAGFRQQIHGIEPEPFGDGCFVDGFNMERQSKFFDLFITNGIGWTTRMILYDSEGRGYGLKDYVSPVYVSVWCSAGDIDVLCESVELAVADEGDVEEGDRSTD
jgi:hypothetical protein